MTLSKPFVTAALVLAPGAVVAQAEGRDYGFHHHDGMMMGGGWFFGPLMLLVFVALVAGAVILVYRALSGGETKGGGDDRALAILRERFAKGEIDEAEFEARRKQLEG
ncbi:MAG: SHOCT domain-containing protein [Pseudomonadota bacterium]